MGRFGLVGMIPARGFVHGMGLKSWGDFLSSAGWMWNCKSMDDIKIG